jgi:choline dehydrogenase-like flavoprotein
MADPIQCDVVIVGSGFAGALIAHELAKKNKKVVILEAGDGIPQDINESMQRFYTAIDKAPESPYTPEIKNETGKLRDPHTIAAGRPTVLSLDPAKWQKAEESYLIQQGPKPFGSTYDRVAGGTSHWLGTCLRFVPNDFKMKTLYGAAVPQFVNWPIEYKDLSHYYSEAEIELGVSANRADQQYHDISIDREYPMPGIPQSETDRRVDTAVGSFTEAERRSLAGDSRPIKVRAVPAARNSQTYRGRRACAGNTNCIPICPIQAKYDPTITLNDALNTGSVRLLHRHVANEIKVDSQGNVSQINYITYHKASQRRADTGSVKAKIYVIAANAIETPRLLLMSKSDRTPDGVANSSLLVGKNLMDHPYYVGWGLLPEDKPPVYPYRGPLITSGIADLCDGAFRSRRGAFRVDIGNEGWNFLVGGMGGDPNRTTLDFVNGTNFSGANKTAAAGGLFGRDLAVSLNKTITRQFRLGFLVEQTPDETNRVTLSTRFTDALGLPRPEISYDLSDYTRRGILAAHQMKELIFQKLGATDHTPKQPPESDPTRFEIDSVQLSFMGAGHIMGTYRMGGENDARISVVNSYQQSHDHKNLYLVGSGTFPTGATANPTLTIAALSLRTAEHMLKNGSL